MPIDCRHILLEEELFLNTDPVLVALLCAVLSMIYMSRMAAIQLGFLSRPEKLFLAAIFDIVSGFVGNFSPQNLLDNGKRHIHSRGHASGGNHAILDHARAAIHANTRPQGIEKIERSPVRSGAASFEKTSLREQERSRANRGGLLGNGRHAADPIERLDIVHQRTRAEAAGYDKDVDARGVCEGVFREHTQIADGANRRGGFCHSKDIEGSGFIRAARLNSRSEPRAREDFKRAGEVQDFDAVKNENADAALGHQMRIGMMT